MAKADNLQPKCSCLTKSKIVFLTKIMSFVVGQTYHILGRFPKPICVKQFEIFSSESTFVIFRWLYPLWACDFGTVRDEADWLLVNDEQPVGVADWLQWFDQIKNRSDSRGKKVLFRVRVEEIWNMKCFFSSQKW